MNSRYTGSGLASERRAELLEPSLERPNQPLYSTTASFWVAFLGGAFAAATFGALNASRAGRLKKDLWISILVSVAWVAWPSCTPANP